MPFRNPYRQYDVLSKWESASFDDRTREVLGNRLNRIPARSFFTRDEWALLDAIAARLVPQPDRDQPVPIAAWIDESVGSGEGEGFRYEDMPPMQDGWRKGLQAIAAEAQRNHGIPFLALSQSEQDELLMRIQHGKADPSLWGDLPPKRFFTDVLLKTVVGFYYSHPKAWSEIGFGGPASPRGYVRMDPDMRDPWEGEEQPDD